MGRDWHIAYTSPNIFGIQAAVSAGLGVSILPEVAILPDHSILSAGDGFPPITDTEVALVVAPEASPATRRLAEAQAKPWPLFSLSSWNAPMDTPAAGQAGSGDTLSGARPFQRQRFSVHARSR
jgi:LysR substrate binding domain